MGSLNGKEIFIGKEPGAGRLLVALADSGKSMATGTCDCVPNSVSRCKAKELVAHAKITIDNDGAMTLTNMKSHNVTYVNGVEIQSKRIEASDKIELGKDKFKVDPCDILECAEKIVTGIQETDELSDTEQTIFNIAHLETVWSDYQNGLRKLRDSQKKINLIRSGCGIFTMCAMPCIFFLGPIGYALTGVGVAGNIYSFVGLKNDKTAEKHERLTEEFQDNYVCPNPKCNKFLGNISYRLLKKQYSMHCPYCKCEYKEQLT